MCGFAGFFDVCGGLSDEKYLWLTLIRRMAGRLSHRGPDGRGALVTEHCALAHVRQAANAAQPMTARQDGFTYSIAFDGMLYNAAELREALRARGESFETESDAEVVLKGYMAFGEDCAKKLNGAFAFVIEDKRRGQVFLCRDRFGAKPLFYTRSGDRLVFASEIKALFEYPGVQPKIGRTGLCELFGLSPMHTPGCGVYENIFEVLPGHCITYGRDGFAEHPYFKLEARPYTESYADTVQQVRALLEDAVNRCPKDGSCAVLEDTLGGEILAALAKKQQVEIYAVENGGGKTDFLTDTVIARDLPGMTDTALYALCRAAKPKCAAAMSSVGADVLFGECPWLLQDAPQDIFPWMTHLQARTKLLKPELLEALEPESYVRERYEEMLEGVPVLRGESAENRKCREKTYLGIYGYMAAELEQADRCGMACGLQIHVPYADHRLVSLLFNTPKAVKNGLLRDIYRDLLPDAEPRAKMPLQKPDNVRDNWLKTQLSAVLRDKEQPIHKLISEKAVRTLMAELFSEDGAQLSIYVLQMNLWLNRYKVKLVL